MRRVQISIDSHDDVDSLYEKLLESLDAPEWHGRNLDALWDTVRGNDINGVRAPYAMIVTLSGTLSGEVETLIDKIQTIFKDAKAEGVEVDFKAVWR